MTLEALGTPLTVCRVASVEDLDLALPIYFIGRTEEEISLVCETASVPAHTTHREDGWQGLRVSGALDFSLVGILARLTGALAKAGIPVFAVSTYNTDYLLVKENAFPRALAALAAAGWTVGEPPKETET